MTALFHYILLTGTPEDAGKMLEEQQALYAGDDGERDWTALHNLALIAQGKTEQVIKALDQEWADTIALRARAQALSLQARDTGNWQPLVDHLDASYKATNEVMFLLDVCRLQAWLGNWTYIADHADVLLAGLQTAATLRLVAEATYSVQQYDRCLALLEEYRLLFPHGSLPSELRLVRAMCLRAVGVISEAIAEAESLARTDPSSPTLLALAQLYFDKGDLWRLTGVARQLIGRADLAPRDALRLADQLKTDHRDIAVELWRYAVSRELLDEEVSVTIGLAFTLGLDKEIAPLMGRMMELAKEGKGEVQLIDLKGLLDMMEPRRLQIEEITSDYLANKLPIHLVAERLNWWLPFLYHNVLKDNSAAPDPARQQAVLIRYGGHLIPDGFPDQKSQGRLIADVTSILLAAHLEILDAVEGVFAPIYVADSLIATLIQMRDQIIPHQRSRPEEFRGVLELFKRGTLHMADLANSEDSIQALKTEHSQLADDLGDDRLAILAQAVSVDGYVVDFLPLPARSLDKPPITLPEGLRDRVVNCRVVIEALREYGALSELDYSAALADLGSQGAEFPSGPLPPAGAQLYLGGELARMLAGANVLDRLCNRFQVFVEQNDLDEARAVVEYAYGGGRELVDWLSALIARISAGLDNESGKYALLPARTRETQTDRPPATPTEDGLLTLMSTQNSARRYSLGGRPLRHQLCPSGCRTYHGYKRDTKIPVRDVRYNTRYIL